MRNTPIVDAAQSEFHKTRLHGTPRPPDGWEVARRLEESNAECICHGNWRSIVKEYTPKFGKHYKTNWGPRGHDDYEYVFFGIVHAEDDYYYGMYDVKTKEVNLLSCVGSIEGFGYIEVEDNEHGSNDSKS